MHKHFQHQAGREGGIGREECKFLFRNVHITLAFRPAVVMTQTKRAWLDKSYGLKNDLARHVACTVEGQSIKVSSAWRVQERDCMIPPVSIPDMALTEMVQSLFAGDGKCSKLHYCSGIHTRAREGCRDIHIRDYEEVVGISAMTLDHHPFGLPPTARGEVLPPSQGVAADSKPVNRGIRDAKRVGVLVAQR